MAVAAAGKEAGRLTGGEQIRKLVAEYGTPLYLLDASRAVAAMKGLSAGLAQYYPRPEITYSVKTNYLASLLRTVLAAGFRLEVVSRHEMALAQENGAGPKDLLFNGPVKSAADLQLCYEQGVDVNVDSLDELEQAASIGTVDRPFRLGMRVAARLQSGAVSRFGLDLDDATTVAGVGGWMKGGTIMVAGLHLHHSSRRDAASFCERLDRLEAVAELLGIQPVTPNFLLSHQPGPVRNRRRPIQASAPSPLLHQHPQWLRFVNLAGDKLLIPDPHLRQIFLDLLREAEFLS